MSRRSLLSLVLLLALTLVPMVALAQDGEQEMETFTSDDGLLTFSYPAEWVIGPYGAEMGGTPFPFVLFSPSQETLDRLNMDEDFAEGDQAMAVVILPTAFFPMLGEEMPAEPTAGDYASLVAMMFFSDEEGPAPEGGEDMGEATEEAAEPAEGEAAEPTEEDAEAAEGEMAEPTEEAMMGGLTLGEPEEVELDEDLTGGLVTMLSGTDEGIVAARQLSDDLVAVVVSAASPGSFTEEQREWALDVLASVEFTGSADEIIEMLMAPPPDVEIEESDVDPATLDGNALIDERCTVCHTRERIDMQDKDEEGWTATVDRMISYGANLDSAERQAVINYLVETH